MIIRKFDNSCPVELRVIKNKIKTPGDIDVDGC